MIRKMWGIHLPGDNEGIPDYGWPIFEHTRPDCVVLMIGQGVTSENMRQIIGFCPEMKAVIGRWWTPPQSSAQDVIDHYVSFVSDTGWNDAIPEHLRWVSPWNEPNKADGGEGFGATAYQMERLNDAFLDACLQIRSANPTWKILFPPLTPGNRDAYFAGDDAGVDYFMHGPEAAKANPAQEEINAAIQSCKCRNALLAADGYGFHMYAINDPGHELWEDWCGMRWRVFQRYFPKPMPIFIKELGIGKEPHHTTDYLAYLREHCPEVEAVAWYKLRDEPLNYFSGNPFIAHLIGWIDNLEPIPEPNGGEQMRAFVGVHYTNDHNATPEARRAFGTAKIEAVKVFNFTNVAEANLLCQINSNVQFLCRLWSGRFGPGQVRPNPQQFIDDVRIGLGVWLEAGCDHFEIHNEPNEPEGAEGFGSSQTDAADFQEWYLQVLQGLRDLFPTALFGFPGLVPYGNDLEWLDWCQDAIEASDFLCAHPYWQQSNHLNPDWGLRYLKYIDRYPSMTIELSEWGNSDAGVSWEEKANQYVEWYEVMMEVSTNSLIRGAYCFILQSPDWEHFAWVDNDGNDRPMVTAVGAMERPPLYNGDPPPPPPDLCEEARNTSDDELVCIIAADFHKVLTFYNDPEHGGWPIGFPDEQRAVICEWIKGTGFQDEYGTWNAYMIYWGCREAPTPSPPAANFTASPVLGDAPLTVQFIDTSLGQIDTWWWDLGDGHFTPSVNPSHTYVEPGNYTVVLTVTGPGGTDSLERIGYIRVQESSEPPPENWEEAVRNEVRTRMGLSYSPESLFVGYARDHNLGAQLTDTFEVTVGEQTLDVQAFSEGIVVVTVIQLPPEPEVSHIEH